jgi:hypothetical protein
MRLDLMRVHNKQESFQNEKFGMTPVSPLFPHFNS